MSTDRIAVDSVKYKKTMHVCVYEPFYNEKIKTFHLYKFLSFFTFLKRKKQRKKKKQISFLFVGEVYGNANTK
jgi:hypothetical protein